MKFHTAKIFTRFAALRKRKANIWLTSTIVLAIAAVYVLVMAAALLGSPDKSSPYNQSEAKQLGIRYNNRFKKLTLGSLLSPHITLPAPVETIPSSVAPPDPTIPPSPPVPSDPTPATQTSLPALNAPKTGDQWPQGSIQTISWNKEDFKNGIYLRLLKGGQLYPGNAASVAGKFELGHMEGSRYVPAHAQSFGNQGVFEWVVPDVPAGNDYAVQAIDGGGVAVAQSGAFSVTAPSQAFQIIAPSAGERLAFGIDYAIKWKALVSLAGPIDIAIYQKANDFSGPNSNGLGGLSYIAKRIPQDWLYIVNGVVNWTWSVSASNNLSTAGGIGGLITSDDATRVIITASDHSASGQSAPFAVGLAGSAGY